jgi:hypothetical protein
MMTGDQIETVKLVYNRLIQNEEETWSRIDDSLIAFEWLSNEELATEVQILCEKHSKGIFRCSQDHKPEQCFAPRVLESVKAILDLYEKTKNLHPKNRYILEYYMVMSNLNMVFSVSALAE